MTSGLLISRMPSTSFSLGRVSNSSNSSTLPTDSGNAADEICDWLLIMLPRGGVFDFPDAKGLDQAERIFIEAGDGVWGEGPGRVERLQIFLAADDASRPTELKTI